VRRLLLSVMLVLAAIVLQLTIVDRLPLPGGVSPDLVLLVVVALALSSGPMTGMITGFCAGLALDIAPPADHLIGVYALVYCLVGYFCGRVAADLDSTVMLPLAASAAGAAGGAALYAGLGILLGDPDVTGQAVRHVLPETVLYDVLLSPFVLYGVALAIRLAGRLTGEPAEGRHAVSSPLTTPTAPGLQGGRTPRIRAAAARRGDGWIGGGGWLAASAELARSRPTTVNLHLGGKRTGPVPGRAASPQGATGGKGVARLRFSTGHRGDGVVGGRLLGTSFFTGLGGGRGLPGPASTPRLFGRHSRPAGPMTRFSRRPAWGFRGAGGGSLGGGAPRRGSFSTNTKRRATASAATPRRGAFSANTKRKATASAATPRRGTFTAAPQRKHQPATGSPRRGSFSGGSSLRGTFGAASPRRGAFTGPRRLRALRGATRRSGNRIGGKSVLGRVRGGRSPAWRNGNKRNGG
jgi:rod shape-determining protein MreD